MIKPQVVRPEDQVQVVGRVFDAPLVVKGVTWFPLAQLAAWPILAWVAGKRKPERSLGQRLGVGALTMPVILGSEWCHNLAHAAAARLVGKPMDAIRIVWGMPLLVYYDINDASVTPREHIGRALGGPIFNALVWAITKVLKPFTRTNSVARDMVEAAEATNAFLAGVGMLPVPGIDGGPVLKWSLVEHGYSIDQADMALRKVNGGLGVVLGGVGAALLKRRRWLGGGFLVMMAGTALSIALGILKEQA